MAVSNARAGPDFSGRYRRRPLYTGHVQRAAIVSALDLRCTKFGEFMDRTGQRMDGNDGAVYVGHPNLLEADCKARRSKGGDPSPQKRLVVLDDAAPPAGP